MGDEETKARAAHDINSPSFSVNDYASELLKTKSLPDLTTYKNTLDLQTTGLNQEMKDLVFNNYQKFISATDTIQKMKVDAERMESSMKNLVEEMKTMGGSSALVNENLQENRGKIEQLVGVKRLLVKLEFLFNLPMRLRQSIELTALSQAVKDYITVRGVLKKYDHMPSIHAIRVEANEIMDSLKEQLRGLLKGVGKGGGGGSIGKVEEAIRLLVQLDEPRAPLRGAYLAFQRTRLVGGLAAFAAKHAPPELSSVQKQLHQQQQQQVSASGSSPVNDGASSLLSTKARAYQASHAAARNAVANPVTSVSVARSLSPTLPTLFVKGANSIFLDAFRYATELYMELFGEEEEEEEGGGGAKASSKEAKDELLVFAKEVTSVYFNTMRRQLSLPPPMLPSGEEASGSAQSGESGGGGSESMTPTDTPIQQQHPGTAPMNSRYESVPEALNILLNDVRASCRLVKEARLPDRAHEAVEAILRAQLDGLFGDVRGDVVRLMLDCVNSAERKAAEAISSTDSGGRGDGCVEAGKILSRMALELGNAVSDRIDASLAESRPLVLASMKLLPDLARAFTGLLHAQVFSLLSWLGAAWEALGDKCHASRVEWSEVVVEAELGLERDSEGAASTSGGMAGGKKRVVGGPHQSPHSVNALGSFTTATLTSSSSAANNAVARAEKRSLVNFGAPEMDQNAPVPAAASLDGGVLTPIGNAGHSTLLLFASLAADFAARGVPRALSSMISSLPTARDLASVNASTAGEEELEGFGVMGGLPDLIKKIRGCGRDILRRFCFYHGNRLGAVVRWSLNSTDWLSVGGEVKEVRSVIKAVLEDVACLKKLVAGALGEWDEEAMVSISRYCGLGAAVDMSSSSSSAVGNPFSPSPNPVSLKGPTAGTSSAALTLAGQAKRTALVIGAASGVGSMGGEGIGSHHANVSSLLSGAGGRNSRGLPMDIERVFSGGGDAGSAVSSSWGIGDTGFYNNNNNPSSVGGASNTRFILGSVDFTADSVSRVLLRLIFKSWLEWTRGLTLSTGGFQQLQCDLAALHAALPFFSTSTPPPPSSTIYYDPLTAALALEELLHEAALSAADRCVEPRPIEAAVCHAITTEFLSHCNLIRANNPALFT